LLQLLADRLQALVRVGLGAELLELGLACARRELRRRSDSASGRLDRLRAASAIGGWVRSPLSRAGDRGVGASDLGGDRAELAMTP
jgi:hypothetical protein